MDAHATAAGTYAKVLATLLALTVITVLAAGFSFGPWNVVIALGIATVKASLVALFFMHLRHDKPMSAIIFVTGAATLGVFLTICVLDSDARRENPVRPATRDSAPPAFSVPPAPSEPGKDPQGLRPLPGAPPRPTAGSATQ
jgi:cytochrome c oxidase subunit 4